MNERIAKIYDQALVLESNGDYVAGELDPVKFAELIVRECMSLAQSHPSQNDDYAAGIDSVRDSIKEHFGVE